MLAPDQSKNVVGELVVVVLKAKDLPNIEVVGKQDPFCIFRLGEVAKRTKTDYRGGQRPVWDDQVNLPVPGNKTKMYVQVFDEDANREELVCEGEIDLTVVLREGEQDKWFPLKFRGKSAGEIYLEMTFYSARIPPKRQPTRLYNYRPQGHRLQQHQQQYPHYQPQQPYPPPVPVQSTSTPATTSSAGPPPYRPPRPVLDENGHPTRPHMPPRMSPSNSTSTPFPQIRPSVSYGTTTSEFSSSGGYPPQQGNSASLLSSPYRPQGRPASYGGGSASFGFVPPQTNFPEPQPMPGNYMPSYSQGGQPFAAHQSPYPPQQGAGGYPPQPGYPPTSGAPPPQGNYPPQQPYGYPPY